MDEAGRFFRYIIPGVTFFVELLLLLLLMQWEWVLGHKSLLKELFVTAGNFTGVLSFIVASGGVGYLLGTIYRGTFELCLSPRYYANIIQDARKQNWNHLSIQVYGQDQNNTNPILLARRSWIVFTFILHERLAFSARANTIINRSESLNNHVHGAGTAFTSSLIAFAVSFISHQLHPSTSWGLYWAGLGIGIVLIIIHCVVYKQTLKFNLGFHKLVFARELDEAYHYFGRKPVTVFVPPNFVENSEKNF